MNNQTTKEDLELEIIKLKKELEQKDKEMSFYNIINEIVFLLNKGNDQNINLSLRILSDYLGSPYIAIYNDKNEVINEYKNPLKNNTNYYEIPLSEDGKYYITAYTNKIKEFRLLASIYSEYIGRKKTIDDYATLDELTGLYNVHSFEIEKNKLKDIPYFFIMIDLNGLKSINDTPGLGHLAGNLYIKSLADVLKETFKNDESFRIGGDEFTVLIRSNTKSYVEDKIEEFNIRLANVNLDGIPAPTAALGYSYNDGTKTFDETKQEADELMYKDKDEYYKRTGKDRRRN